MSAAAQLATRPRFIPAADANRVMREQLAYLLEHAVERAETNCLCAVCVRYARLREIFAVDTDEDKQAKVAAIQGLIEELIDHAGKKRCECGCEVCLRYLRARSVLLIPFRDEKVDLRKEATAESDVPF